MTITTTTITTHLNLDDLLDAGAGFREDGLHVLDALGCLFGDGAFDDLRVGIGGDLAGDVNDAIGFNGLGL